MNTMMMKLGLPTVLLLVAGGLTSYAPAASAQVQGKPLKNVGNDLCLAATTFADVAITKECLPLQTWSRLQIQGSSDYVLKNVNYGRCLTSSDTGIVTMQLCNGSNKQRWKMLNTTPVPALARYRSVFNGDLLTSNGVGPVFTAAPAPATAPSAQKLQTWVY